MTLDRKITPIVNFWNEFRLNLEFERTLDFDRLNSLRTKTFKESGYWMGLLNSVF